MKTTKTINISNLKKGDLVLFYGQDFRITKDAYELEHRPGIFVARCEIVEKMESEEWSALFLNDYNGFQGNQNVYHQVINQ